MEKRGRGRPRKIASDYLGETVAKCDGEVPHSDKLPEFFKFYVPALCSERMIIPPEFIDKFGEDVPTIITLKIPSGISWQVDMNRINDHWFFQKGWPEFVQGNFITYGDFLNFCYAGNSTLYVKVFAINGCRKRVDNLQQNESSELNETSESENSEHSESNQRNVRPRRRTGRKYICGNRSFSVVMTKSYIHNGWLHIPMEFGRAYMSDSVLTTVTLWMQKKSWNVDFSVMGDRILLTKGWLKFVTDNSLRTRDLCTFQMIDVNDLAFNVTVDG